MEQIFNLISSLDDSYLMFPAFEAAFDKMIANLETFRKTGFSQHLLIVGESGSGKTTLADLFVQNYPRISRPEGEIVPVLYVAIPPAATIAGTVEAILAQLGDPAPAQGTVSVKTARAVALALSCRVEMLVIDEAQHIQDRGKSQTQYFVGDWLKAFMDSLGRPVTMLGLPRTRHLLNVNEQLRRRFTQTLKLTVGSEKDEVDEAESLELFTSLVKALPTRLDRNPYTWGELAVRLNFATAGRIAYVKLLLIGAAENLINMGDNQLQIIHLETGFRTHIWSDGVNGLNPFHSTFTFRPLIQVGEPFHREDIERNVRTKSGRLK
ncbi:transposase [Herbaspirillum seropedicae]|uniref:TniB family NTP-binding protein n=1 Tax=Herbaspirillum seropedicae TaxID=964 RepID=UPI00111FBB2C|nr:TniB family NTP-binding protein [Herbaspirillum seropedicae]QDD62693.1 transposase [Herbaspirillum seropedicae]